MALLFLQFWGWGCAPAWLFWRRSIIIQPTFFNVCMHRHVRICMQHQKVCLTSKASYSWLTNSRLMNLVPDMSSASRRNCLDEASSSTFMQQMHPSFFLTFLKNTNFSILFFSLEKRNSCQTHNAKTSGVHPSATLMPLWLHTMATSHTYTKRSLHFGH